MTQLAGLVETLEGIETENIEHSRLIQETYLVQLKVSDLPPASLET